MYFAEDLESELDPPTGFIASSNGLLVSTNGGLSWTLRNDQHQFEHLAMANPQFGSAITSTGIFTTSDGGRTWTQTKQRTEAESSALGLRDFQFETQKAMFSNKIGGNRSWLLNESWDGGDNWNPSNGTAERPMDVAAFWTDSSNLHTVGRAGVIQRSESGNVFSLENDSVETFNGLGGYVIAGQDASYIYVIAPGNGAGRFRMYKRIPVSVPVTPGGAVTRLALAPNPIRGNSALIQVELSEATNIVVRVYDLLGKPVQSVDLGRREAGAWQERLNVQGLSAGHYRLEVSTADGQLHTPLVILH